MNWCKALCALSILVYSSCCLAQDITDVEAKPYGSYTGGAIDTVDLATGNLMLNIPLISFPQRGALPPLSFSVELNNAPYSQIAWICDPLGQRQRYQQTDYVADCMPLSSRYDTSPPGAVYQYQNPNTANLPQESDVSRYTDYSDCLNLGANGSPCGYADIWGAEYNVAIQSMGAYLTSSFEGGIVTGQFTSIGDYPYQSSALLYSLIDPSGTTHELESDVSSSNKWSTYHSADGSGYTFIPKGTNSGYDLTGYDPWDPDNTDMGLSSTEAS